MATRDIFHQAVRNALLKAGWTITHDPLVVQYGGVGLYIDLGAERLIAAERNGERIAVEIKSFLGASLVTEFHTALGQFLNYRLALDGQDPERTLYLAVPTDTYGNFFVLPFVQSAIARHRVNIIVDDHEIEETTQWIG